VPLVVAAELPRVLRFAGWARERILKALLRTRGVTVEAPQVAQAAIDATRKGRGGFVDHLIAQVGFADGCREGSPLRPPVTAEARGCVGCPSRDRPREGAMSPPGPQSTATASTGPSNPMYSRQGSALEHEPA
jgi:hypothetical protein